MSRAAAATGLRVSVHEDFSAPALDAGRWDALLARSPTDVVFLTAEWQRLWWRAFADEQLLIVLAERDGQELALAPLFAVEGSVSLLGSGNSDYLDFIGRPDEAVLAAMLRAARDAAEDFSGIELYHVPLDSPTTAMLPGLAARLGLELHREDAPGGPYAELADRELVERLTARRSVRKEEARMRRRRRAAGADRRERGARCARREVLRAARGALASGGRAELRPRPAPASSSARSCTPVTATGGRG